LPSDPETYSDQYNTHIVSSLVYIANILKNFLLPGFGVTEIYSVISSQSLTHIHQTLRIASIKNLVKRGKRPSKKYRNFHGIT